MKILNTLASKRSVHVIMTIFKPQDGNYQLAHKTRAFTVIGYSNGSEDVYNGQQNILDGYQLRQYLQK